MVTNCHLAEDVKRELDGLGLADRRPASLARED
jgi:hypothetical protein